MKWPIHELHESTDTYLHVAQPVLAFLDAPGLLRSPVTGFLGRLYGLILLATNMTRETKFGKHEGKQVKKVQKMRISMTSKAIAARGDLLHRHSQAGRCASSCLSTR